MFFVCCTNSEPSGGPSQQDAAFRQPRKVTDPIVESILNAESMRARHANRPFLFFSFSYLPLFGNLSRRGQPTADYLISIASYLLEEKAPYWPLHYRPGLGH